jgi:hypothetical protein
MNITYEFLFALCTISAILAQPDGWKMTDRFYGFRYELTSQSFSASFEKDVQKHADDLGCFGWIQNTPDKNKVGEIRCSKAQGPKFASWLTSEAQVSPIVTANIKVYEDTKIRLHFSHFKVLDDGRDNTCFAEPPHQCPEYRAEASKRQQSVSSSSSGEEL